MEFSDIVQRFDTSLNALYRERNGRRAQGLRTVDLVSGNVNQAGFVFPPHIVKSALDQGARQARIYRPDPLGQSVAREAIRAFYLQDKLRITTDQILLTPGTSVSYWYLFKLLANPGDEILCPRPSYPLLDAIADLCGVRLTPYRLLEKDRWEIDLEHLNTQVTTKTRAIILISPHNPTGTVASEEELAGLASIATRHHLPIISDEVFSAFLFTQKRLPRPATRSVPLAFTLNGVSKMLALPGLKIGWIGVSGETTLVKKAMQALDMMSDTFLPVNEATQFALPTLFKRGKPFLIRFQQDIQARVTQTLRHLQGTPGVSSIPPEGGFYLTLRLNDKTANEEKWAVELLRKEGLLLHPGYFYDLPGAHWVLSFVSPPQQLKSSLEKIKRFLTQKHLSS